MCHLADLYDNNRLWAADKKAQDPLFFERLAAQQTPKYLWIGCADSRVPANEIVGLAPGELFVHRNIANLVHPMDYNCMSVVQYAVEVLKVEHIIVTGHYGCGGVQAAMDTKEHGLVDSWLRSIKDIYYTHYQELQALRFRDQRLNRLCELNVMAQVVNLAKSKSILHAWQRGQKVSIHGAIYSICDGLLKDLNVTIANATTLSELYNLQPTERGQRPDIRPSLCCSLEAND
ncbi:MULTISPECIES: carbonate dehydratase [unclassified Pseudoalteromonas]|uniref:carbonate dehydratase n=1 Tax=unclassified Pseudoalteromonas TaxID=194690 RepID=UPI000CF7053A|nr:MULTISPECIES: carbonate dehydratase [unclassified Pseudoalteromonas]MBS3798046.1 carbonate dehydratase [Pseudoalteromonas sp. BDTF-M6]